MTTEARAEFAMLSEGRCPSCACELSVEKRSDTHTEFRCSGCRRGYFVEWERMRRWVEQQEPMP